MNKHLIACAAVLACSQSALAQSASSVEIYGLIDVGIEHVTGVGASGDSLQRMTTSSNTAPSRLGFRGSEDLGAGMKAFFTLEQGIVMSTGGLGQGGRAFGRQALADLLGTQPTAVTQFTDRLHQGGRIGGKAVAQHMNSRTTPGARQLHTINKVHIQGLGSRAGFIQAFKGVVIGQGQHLHPVFMGARHHCRRR